MDSLLILICFAFPGQPNECGIATLETTAFNTNTVVENVTLFCEAAEAALIDNYPGASLESCTRWSGEPLESTRT
jgi:hypothetical protein